MCLIIILIDQSSARWFLRFSINVGLSQWEQNIADFLFRTPSQAHKEKHVDGGLDLLSPVVAEAATETHFLLK